MMIYDPFAQMAEDARREAEIFRMFMEPYEASRGVKIWELVSIGYSYYATEEMLGMDHGQFERWWNRRDE